MEEGERRARQRAVSASRVVSTEPVQTYLEVCSPDIDHQELVRARPMLLDEAVKVVGLEPGRCRGGRREGRVPGRVGVGVHVRLGGSGHRKVACGTCEEWSWAREAEEHRSDTDEVTGGSWGV